MNNTGWIGVDLDGTLAHYDGWKSCDHIGEPVPLMLQRVMDWLREGRDVRIFTARISCPEFPMDPHLERPIREAILQRRADARVARTAIWAWCEKHLGRRLQITCQKDYAMVELWDDRAFRVEQNTGFVIGHR